MKYLIALSIMIISGCSTMQQQAAFNAIDESVQSIKSINDANFSGSQELYCNGQSTGAVSRALGDNAEMWELYWSLCNRYRGDLSDMTVPPLSGE